MKHDPVKLSSTKGSQSRNAIINEEIVREIRMMHRGGTSRTEIAKEFGLSKTAVQAVITRRTWGHVF